MEITWSGVLLIASCGLYLLTLMLGRKLYGKYLSLLDKKEFPLKESFCAGWCLMVWSGYSYDSAFDHRLRGLLRQVHDRGFDEFYLRVYWAAGATYAMIGLILSFLASVIGKNSLAVAAAGVVLTGGVIWGRFRHLQRRVYEQSRQIDEELGEFTAKLLKEMKKEDVFSRALVTGIRKHARESTRLGQALWAAVQYFSADPPRPHRGKMAIDKRCETALVENFTEEICRHFYEQSATAAPCLQRFAAADTKGR